MAFILHTVFALLLVLTTALVSAQDEQIPLVCHEGVQIIAVVGGNVPNGTDSFGLTVTFVSYVMNDIPDSANFSVNYNRFHPVNQSGATFIPEVTEGVPALYQALNSYITACPNTPVVIHGYSEGAVVVGNLLCGASSNWFWPTNPLPSSYASHIIAVILYGDETRTANQSYNYGDCTADAPHLPRHHPQGCDAFAPTMQSYCFANDVDCCANANASAPYPYGINPHYLYPAGYDNTAVAFVVDQYNRYKNGTLGQSTTTSSTVPIFTSFSTTTSIAPSSTIVITSTSTTSSSSPFSTSSSTTTSKTSTAPTSTSSSTTTSTAPLSTSSSTTTSKTSTSTSTSSTTSTAPPFTSTSSKTSFSPSSTTSSSTVSTTSTSLTSSSISSTIPISSSSSSSTSITSAPSITTSSSFDVTITSTTVQTTRTALSVQPTCTVDKCLSSFAAHPTIASRYCGSLTAGTVPTNTPFPTVCAGNYAGNVASACNCLIIPTPANNDNHGLHHSRTKTKTKTKTTSRSTSTSTSTTHLVAVVSVA